MCLPGISLSVSVLSASVLSAAEEESKSELTATASLRLRSGSPSCFGLAFRVRGGLARFLMILSSVLTSFLVKDVKDRFRESSDVSELSLVFLLIFTSFLGFCCDGTLWLTCSFLESSTIFLWSITWLSSICSCLLSASFSVFSDSCFFSSVLIFARCSVSFLLLSSFTSFTFFVSSFFCSSSGWTGSGLTWVGRGLDLLILDLARCCRLRSSRLLSFLTVSLLDPININQH